MKLASAVVVLLSSAVFAATPIPSGTTTAPLTVYVTATGSDTNACTQVAKPCLTIQRAIDQIPKHPSHPVTVNIGAGTFKGAYIEGFQFQKSQAYLQILGTYVPATLASGVTTGTFTSTTAGSGLTWATGTMTGAGWTIDDLRGKLVQITSGPTMGIMQVAVIVHNTSDTITIPGAWPNGDPGNVNFAIVDWGTRINDGVVRPAYSLGGAASTSTYGFYISATSAVALVNANMIGLDAIAFDSLTGAGVYHASTSGVQIRHMKFTGLGSTYSYGVFVGSAGCSLSVYSSVFDGSDPNMTGIQSNATYTYISNNLFYGSFYNGVLLSNSAGFISSNEFTTSVGANSTAVTLDYANRASVYYCKIYGPIVGVGIRNGGHQLVSTSQIDSTTAAIYANRGSYVEVASLVGSGNTVALQAFGGSTYLVDPATSISGTNDIAMTGAAGVFYTSLAQLRSLVPKVISDEVGNAVYGN